MGQDIKQLLTIKEASQWASDFLKRDISDSNISYLVQYGKIRKHNGGNSIFVDIGDLKKYYDSYRGKREINWKRRLGDDLNWALSFDHLREKDTTKHVHRLHPYKGKFIPQLVEYFIDGHTDNFKKDIYFKAGDIILDPFCGSGTTLVQANEMGIHSIGIDISHFKGQGWNKGNSYPFRPKLSLDQILVKRSNYQSYKLKRRLFMAGLKNRAVSLVAGLNDQKMVEYH